MGLTSYTQEFTSSVAAKRMFTALHIDFHNLMPKLAPHAFKSIECIHGDGGAGSIRITHFPEGSPIKFMKHKIDELDADNLSCKFTMIEGDVLSEKLDSIVTEVKFETSGVGCCCKMTTHIHTKGDIMLKEEEINEGKQKAEGMFKIVEGYLQANPDIYA